MSNAARLTFNQPYKRQSWPTGAVVHADRGCLYASEVFIQLKEAFGFIRSMRAKGNGYHNAAMESFFGVFKREEPQSLMSLRRPFRHRKRPTGAIQIQCASPGCH